MSHEIMENLYLGKIKYEDMDSEFEDAWMTAGIAELKFDRNDSEKNKISLTTFLRLFAICYLFHIYLFLL